jgi:site-specific DNA recombinase
MKKMRVGLYVRVSTVEQAEEGYSVGEQTKRLTKYCEAMGWDIFRTYTDAGYSGGSMDRPGLNEMITDIQAGLLEKIVVYKLDRLSRSQYDTLYLIEKVFIPNNTDFVSMTENFNTSSSLGKAMLGFLAVFAELEKSKISERMMMGKQARAKEGKWCGGRNIPIGYDYDQPNDIFIINDFEALQYKELVRLFLSGCAFREIQRIFTEKGYAHKHGTWSPKTMRSVLRSKTYLGYIKYDGQWNKAAHTPLIDEETYDRVVNLLDQRAEEYKQTGGKAGVVSTYLGGLLYCRKCGAKYGKDSNGRRDKNGNKKYKYVCYSRSKKMRSLVKDPNCKNKNWNIDELDEIILGEIKKLALDPELVREAQEEREEKSDAAEEIKILKKEIKKIDEQISRFMDLYGVGKFTIEQVSDKVDPLNEQRDALNREIDYLSRKPGQLGEEETMEILSSVEDLLEDADFDEIRAIIEALIYKIELDDEDIYIYWKFA